MNYLEYKALLTAVREVMNGRTVTIEENSELIIAVDEIMNCRTVTIEENSDWRSDVKTFGVNWSCFGTQSIEEAKKFAEQISKACKIVEKLNAMKINVNYESEGKTNREAYKAMITKYMEELQG